MAYTKLGWVNDQAPALNQTNLNHMDQGIYDAHQELAEYEDIFAGDLDDLSDDLSDLKSEFGDKTDLLNIDLVGFQILANYYVDSSNGAFVSYTNLQNPWSRTDYIRIDESVPLEITITRAGTDNAFYDKNKSFVSGFSLAVGKNSITPPQGVGYMAISSRSSDMANLVIKKNVPNAKLNALEKDLDEITTKVTTKQLYDRTLAKSGYMTLDGTIGSNATYVYSPKINVSKNVGETIYFSENCVASSARYITVFNSDGVATPSLGAESVSQFTIPVGAYEIVITHTTNVFQAEFGGITPTADYISSLIPTPTKNIIGLRSGANPLKSKGDISNGGSLEITAFHAKKEKTISFYAKVENFAGVRLGEGYGLGRGYNIHITSTGVSYQSGGTDGNPILHGLTIKDYIGAVIHVDAEQVSHVFVFTNGGTWKREVVNWLGSDSQIFASADTGTSLKDATLSFSCSATKKNIWWFGDSYISMAQSRYPYYLNEMGFWKNVFADGFSGAKSADIYPDVELLANMGVAPTYIVWAMGMNDADSSSAVNASWYARYQYLSELCDKNGIELILATIPCTPIQNNSFKNALVRLSGRRYIDFASAVNTSQDATTWFDGMLSADNVHPTEAGAMALAQAVLADIPEIAISD